MTKKSSLPAVGSLDELEKTQNTPSDVDMTNKLHLYPEWLLQNEDPNTLKGCLKKGPQIEETKQTCLPCQEISKMPLKKQDSELQKTMQEIESAMEECLSEAKSNQQMTQPVYLGKRKATSLEDCWPQFESSPKQTD